MAIGYENDKNAKAITDALMKRYGSTMNGGKPGYKPDPTKKTKPIVKPGLIGFKTTLKF